MKKTELLREIKKEVVELKSSPLYQERIKNNVFPVIGEGNHDADIMFVGEAPGAKEAATGRPFCGNAGKILDNCLQENGLKREETYITNIVKDRPPRNRDPLPEEIEAYRLFLDRQIEIIQPKIIVSLGRFSTEYILTKFKLEKELKPITALHGKIFNTETNYGKVKIIPIFHPAVAVHDPRKKDTLREGFKVLKNNL